MVRVLGGLGFRARPGLRALQQAQQRCMAMVACLGCIGSCRRLKQIARPCLSLACIAFARVRYCLACRLAVLAVLCRKFHALIVAAGARMTDNQQGSASFHFYQQLAGAHQPD